MNDNLENKLVIIPSVGIWLIDGEFYLDRKFYDGIISYCNRWHGIVNLIVRVVDCTPPVFGLIKLDIVEIPAIVTILKNKEILSNQHLLGADVVLASADNYKNLHLSMLCKQQEIKIVYIIEYILETRLQILGMSDSGLWKKAKSLIWHLLTERKRRKAFSFADGIQANGLPAYNTYRKFVSNTLLYLDSRNSENMSINQNELESRLSYLDKDKMIRLGFSGRLISIKGADHLVKIALTLKQQDINFEFYIFGDGNLAPLMNEMIENYELENMVYLKGSVDYEKELIPFIKTNIDLFVCCHRQSDPSCTYIETYSCGVPIIGYNNKAHQGILDADDVGWSVLMNDYKALATKIVYLDQHRDEIKEKSRNARQFSLEHSFEKTFSRRIAHCQSMIDNETLYLK